jgi:hypothetical protein
LNPGDGDASSTVTAQPIVEERARVTPPSTPAAQNQPDPKGYDPEASPGWNGQHQRNHLKRFSPAAVLLAAAAFVMLIDAAIMVVPRALADPEPSSSANIQVVAALDPAEIPIWPPTADPSATPWWPAPTVFIRVPTPTPAPPTPAPTPKPTPKPTPRDTVWNARIYVKSVLGARGYNCINAIWTAESKWNPRAGTLTSAYGIPQAFPASKMAAFGSNWRYSPLVQVKWGLWYVRTRYGSACAAYNFWKAYAWY